jgi:hypothetical protein
VGKDAALGALTDAGWSEERNADVSRVHAEGSREGAGR